MEDDDDDKSDTSDEVFQSILPKSKLNRMISSIHAIINSLLRLNVAIRNPAPLDRYSKSKVIDVSHWERPDREHIQEFFPKLAGFLQSRLLNAVLERRQFLEYSARHHFKLAQGLNENDSIDAVEGESESIFPGYSNTAASSGPTDVSVSQLFREITDKEETGSDTSYASSTSSIWRRGVPRPPSNAVLGGDPFECPYCYLMVCIQNKKAWK